MTDLSKLVSIDSRNILARPYLTKLKLKNFMAYDDFEIDIPLNSDDSAATLFGLYGPNGTGKTTFLEAIVLLFANFSCYSPGRIRNLLSRYVRNLTNDYLSNESSFEVVGSFVVDWENRDVCYDVVVTRDGVVQGHPDYVRENLNHHVFMTRYDTELNLFQLRRDRWSLFQELFELTTGYPVTQRDSKVNFDGKSFDLSGGLMDIGMSNQFGCQEDFVLGIWVHKDNETITERQCSDGERKVLKNLTTLLNMEHIPSIILIDNVEMHVEIGRHMALLNAIERMFPESQVVFTTHSPEIILQCPADRLMNLRTKELANDQADRLEKISRVALLLLRSQDKTIFDDIDCLPAGEAAEKVKALFRKAARSVYSDLRSIAKNG